MKTIYVGGYGAGNLGDDLILSAILEEEPNATIVAYGRPLLEKEVPYIGFDEFFREAAEVLPKFERIVFGGGGLFWSSEHIFEMLVISLIAKNHGLRVEFSRIGVQGFHYATAASRHLLKLADVVSFREQDSANLARQYLGCESAIVVPDYACSIVKSVPKIFGGRAKIGINVASTKFIDDVSFSNHVQLIYSEVAKRFSDVADFFYVPFCMHVSSHNQNDLAKADLLFSASHGSIKLMESAQTAEQLVAQCADIDIFLGERFHMHIIAHALGRPFVPLIHNDQAKYRALAFEYRDAPIFYENSQALIVDLLVTRLNERINAIRIAGHASTGVQIEHAVPSVAA